MDNSNLIDELLMNRCRLAQIESEAKRLQDRNREITQTLYENGIGTDRYSCEVRLQKTIKINDWAALKNILDENGMELNKAFTVCVYYNQRKALTWKKNFRKDFDLFGEIKETPVITKIKTLNK